ncbi:MAG TPA: hypothetical protein VJT67_13725 [Longimicrobiaceae bacterium]|nr:hypothetical protein [Longimicrobiaceae bacterium]
MTEEETGDPLIDEIRAIRAKISREHGDDPQRLCEHYMEYQKQFAGRLISRTFTPEEETRFQQGLEKLRRMTPEEFERWVAEDEEVPSSDTSTPANRRQDRSAA